MRLAALVVAIGIAASGTAKGSPTMTAGRIPQAHAVRAHPAIFAPFPGAWGRYGCTRVRLEAATPDAVRFVLLAAWRKHAPERLRRELGGR